MKLTKSFATLNLNELTHDELLNVLETAVNGAKLQIQQFAQRPDFSDKMSLVFGTSPAGLQGAWADGLVTVPEIEIVSRREIDGANGAFAAATDSIYLAKEFLTENINQPDAIVQVVLEELGHYVDDLINHGADTPGDEGAKFSAFVLGENLSASELAQLDNENDKAKVILGGQVVEIEKAELAVVVNSLGDIGARDNPNTQNVDESSDGIFGDYETGEITLRAALEEASNLGKSIDITFGVTGTINLLDSSISIPDGSSIIASSKEDGSPQVKINGDYSGLIVGSNTSIKNLAIIVQNSIAIDVLGSNNQIDSNILSGSRGLKIYGDNNLVIGNKIGNDGTSALGGFFGIEIEGNNNIIGGTEAAQRNIISGNQGTGITINGQPKNGGKGNIIKGNYIGVNADGSEALPNNTFDEFAFNEPGGILIVLGSDNIIGGTEEGAGNVISGNNGYGVEIRITTGTIIQGNLIGTDATGTLGIGNNSNGIHIGGDNNTVGGTTSAARNIISGNKGSGLTISGGYPPLPGGGLGELIGSGNIIQGNYIGTDITGTLAIGNGDDTSSLNEGGISIIWGFDNTIGGIEPGSANIISGNNGHGIQIWAVLKNSDGGQNNENIEGGNDNLIKGNLIGTDVTGEKELGNSGTGIFIGSGSNNTIGGKEPGESNTIAFNERDGIAIGSFELTPNQNSILSNSIFSNKGLGIDLGNNSYLLNDQEDDDGISSNDQDDSDEGPNNLQNFPIITSILRNEGSLTIKGKLNSEPSKTYIIQLFDSGEPPEGRFSKDNPPQGKELLKTIEVTTDGDGKAEFNETINYELPKNQVITATATDPDGNTSEFSFNQPPFEYLAKDFIYKDWSAAEGDKISGEGYQYEVNYVWDLADGFYAVGLTSEVLPPILVIRGTELETDFFVDVFADVVPESVGFNQYQNSRNSVIEWLTSISTNTDKNPGQLPPDITGHSLGGALAQLFAADFSKTGKLGQVITFNSPGIEKNYVDGVNIGNIDEVIHYVTSGDIISLAGEAFLPGSYYLSSFSDKNLIHKHLNPVTIDSVVYDPSTDPNAYTKPDPLNKAFFPSVDALNSPLFHYNDPDYFAFQLSVATFPLTLNLPIEILIPALDFTASIAALLSTRFTVESTRQILGSIEAIQVLSDAAQLLNSNSSFSSINDALEAARQWASDAAWDAISNWAENAWDAVRYWGNDLSLPLIQQNIAQSSSLRLSTTSEIQPMLMLAAVEEATITNSAWAATTQWTDAAWEATTEWSDEVWEATKSWTDENWNNPFFIISDPTLVEGNADSSNLIFNISLSATSTQTVTIDYTTTNGTAIADEDYIASQGTLEFAPGEIEKTVIVQILGDTVVEEDETFTLNFSNANNGTIAENQGIGTIQNDDLNSENTSPFANNDTATTNEETAVVINVLGNDTDTENNLDVTTVEIVTNPTNGTVNVNATTGEITYTPNNNFSGEDSFTYTVKDTEGATSNVGTVNVTVNPVNDPPVAVDDTETTAEETAVLINVLNNDTDVDSQIDITTVEIVTNPANGTVNVNETNGEITYTPNENFSGEDSFTYTVKDTEGATSNVGEVKVTVTPVNDPPVAVDDIVTTNEDRSIIIRVNENDIDPDNNLDPKTIQIVSNPTRGTVTFISTTGEIVYTPNSNVSGDDNFTYTIKDTNGEISNLANVRVTVNPVNDLPIANDDNGTTPQSTAFITEEGQAITINVLNNDSDIDGVIDPTTVTIGTNPGNGTVSVNSTTGLITYTPKENFFGKDNFTYTVRDTNGGISNVAMVNISVNSVNDLPVANNDSVTTEENESVVINVIQNDTDVENNLVANTVTIARNPNNGRVKVIAETGEIIYTPDSILPTNDSFTYTVKDADGGTSNTATVNVNVIPEIIGNDPQLSIEYDLTTQEDSSIIFRIPGDDNANNNPFDNPRIDIGTNPRFGKLSIDSETKEITYTPNQNFVGEDSFTYTIQDGTQLQFATVNIDVLAINDAPIAVNDSATTDEDESLTINVLSNDSDAENNLVANTVTLTSNPRYGTVSINNSTGAITYTPDDNFSGNDSFTYTVKDNNGATSNVANVDVTVNPINDAPVANNDNQTTKDNQSIIINVLENDVDPENKIDVTTVEIVTSPTKGTLIVSETTGEIIYTPNGQDLGADSFTYTVKDTSGVTSNVATVNLTVNPSNTAPVANDDNVTTIEKTAVVFKVLDNDTDAENNIDVRTLEIATQPQNGTVNLNATTGEITYTPQDDFLGNDSFTYTVKDTNGLTSNVGTVNILVRPANTDPVANDDNVTTLKDESVIINVLNNDTDAENNIDITTLKIESQPENGTLSVDEQTGEITYTPVTGFIGNDSFTYTVQDTTGRVSNIATVNVRVNEFNNNPANFNNDQIFELGGNENQTKQLKLSFVSQNTKFVNEIGVFRIDNEQGGINGITPDNPNYLQTALENSQVVFSSLPNNVLQGVEFTRLLNFEGSDRLVFYLVQNSTTETVLSDLAAGRTPANVLLALPTANSNGFDPLDISDLNNESFTLAWRDNFNSNDNTFDDLVMKVEIVDATSSPIGTGLQGQIELIDLRNLGTLEAKFKVASEAAYNNTIGWYVVDDETGRIGDLKPGDAGYAQAAIAQRSITHFTREGIESAQLQGLLAPYLIADASRESFLANNPNNINGNGPVAYFAFMGANPDGVDHVRQLGDNTFGFEDLFGGGDRDYNDIIIQVEFA